MPKRSKIKSAKPGSKPGNAAPVTERNQDKFYCTRCTRSYNKQRTNFPMSQSPIFKENGGFVPVCRHCVEEMYQHYREVLCDEKQAIRRICLKFDIYWSDKIYAMLNKSSTTNSRVLGYISKANLYQFTGKTYDDTLDEEALIVPYSYMNQENGDENNLSDSMEELMISQDIIDFWGSGLTPSFYAELERRYKYWCGDNPDEMDVGERAVIKQICILEVTINRDIAEGKSVDRNINALNTLLGSANLKPVQRLKDDSQGSVDEQTPFGVWIRKIENTRPISEPDPDMKDVDGIAKYISVWFLGHLCKMLKINNKYSAMYEDEMERLRVVRPEYEGEDEETVLEDIFERANHIGDSNVMSSQAGDTDRGI